MKWKLPLALFVASVFSILLAGAIYTAGYTSGDGDAVSFRLRDGIPFAVALLGILLTHEFGHFTAARIHRVNASLPLFIPFPYLSLFGTLGAVIVMRDRIRSRNALLDIGASGPLAGMVVAIPVLWYGLAHSKVVPIAPEGIMEGQSLLYVAMKWLALGRIPAGHEVVLSPVALAGWVGLFVTMLNLLPSGQLDGGHVAYALFGERQQRYAMVIRKLLVALAALNFGWHASAAWRHMTRADALMKGLETALPWLVWFVVLSLLRRAAHVEHPPTDPGELSPARRVVAVATLVLFVLLFMPTIMQSY